MKTSRILILTFGLIFGMLSCKDRINLRGVWEMSYSIHGGNKLMARGTSLLDFTADSVRFVQISDDEHGVLDTVIVESNAYEVNDTVVMIDPLKKRTLLRLVSLTFDSLSFKINDLGEIYVAKRLSRPRGEPVQKSDLVGQGYKVLTGHFVDKLDFINDTSLLLNDRLNYIDWSITSYNGFDFLCVDWPFFPKIPLYKSNGEILAMINEGADTARFEKLQPINRKDRFNGKWTAYKRIPSPPLPLWVEDTLQMMTIDADSIRIRRFGKTRKYLFEISAEGTVIHFGNAPPTGTDSGPRLPYEVMKLSDEELILMQRVSNDSTLTIYRKSM